MAEKLDQKFGEFERKLAGKSLDRSELKARREELHSDLNKLSSRRYKHPEIDAFVKKVKKTGALLRERFDNAKTGKDKEDTVNDLTKELALTSQSRNVYTIVMSTLEAYYKSDKDTYYEVSAKIRAALQKRLGK